MSRHKFHKHVRKRISNRRKAKSMVLTSTPGKMEVAANEEEKLLRAMKRRVTQKENDVPCLNCNEFYSETKKNTKGEEGRVVNV